jgi:hypothetical protein
VSLLVLAAHVAAMRAAFERGDLDEAARQGALAGPANVERALAAADRTTVLAAITAAPAVTDAPELLPSLARLAAGPDRRTAIPAAGAAVAIAHHLARAAVADDDLAAEDLATWRDAWSAIARSRDRWIEVRIAALDVATSLDAGAGPELGVFGVDPDAAMRAAAIALVPAPVPPAARAALATIVIADADDRVALDAAAALCGDLALDPPRPILDALGDAGVARIMALVGNDRSARARDAARCLKK